KSVSVMDNMGRGVRALWGLDSPALHARNQRLIMLSTSNLGQPAPRATHPGFGSQLSSLSGFPELIGAADGPPQCLYGPYIDMVAVAYGGGAGPPAPGPPPRARRGALLRPAPPQKRPPLRPPPPPP